jgi:hypothetical protein
MRANAATTQPQLGHNDLGVRLGYDIPVDSAGNVHPVSGGMSVAPDDPLNLHQHFRPRELGGTGKKPVWWAHRAKLGPDLAYRADPAAPTTHGLVEPAETCTSQAYEAALAATASDWELFSV